MIHDLVNEFISMLKPFKKIFGAIIVTIGIAILCLTGWNTVRLHRLETSLQDVYFMEYGIAGGTTIHKYDVDQRETVTVAVLDGSYDDCRINRREGYIIGQLYSYKTKETVWMKYNLADNTTEEITGKEAELIEEYIKEEENKLPEQSSLPEQVKKIVGNGNITWSLNGEKGIFCDGDQRKMYLYDINTEKCICILKAGWNQAIPDDLGMDASGNYVFYENFFNRFFAADVSIVIYDIQTGMKTKIYERKNTQNYYRFVQEMECDKDEQKKHNKRNFQ